MSFNMNFPTMKRSSMSLGPSTVGFSNLPKARSKQTLKSVMV